MAVYQRCIKLCINVEMRDVARMALYQRLSAFMNVTKLEKVTFDIRCYAIANAALLSPPPSRYVHIRQSDGIPIAIPKNHFDFRRLKRTLSRNTKNEHYRYYTINARFVHRYKLTVK